MHNDNSPTGIWRIRPMVWIDGELAQQDTSGCEAFGNLVVNGGRDACANNLRQGTHRWINAIQLGFGIKSLNPPNLNNSGVAAPFIRPDSSTGGIFTINQTTEMFTPARARRFPLNLVLEWGGTGTVAIDAAGVTTLTSSAVDFTTISLQLSDHVVLNSSTATPLKLAIKRIVNSTTLELHNPYGYGGVAVQFRIESPGGQLLISKLIRGNDMPSADFGPLVVVTESCLLLNDGAAFNRVIYASGNDARGILIQPVDVFGTELGATFEILITF